MPKARELNPAIFVQVNRAWHQSTSETGRVGLWRPVVVGGFGWSGRRCQTRGQTNSTERTSFSENGTNRTSATPVPLGNRSPSVDRDQAWMRCALAAVHKLSLGDHRIRSMNQRLVGSWRWPVMRPAR